jgi:hypothetical protein
VELDPVGGDPGLTVEEVEEGDPDDLGAGARPSHTRACHPHLRLPVRRGVRRARGRVRGFRDHVIRPAAENDVEVLVVLFA